MHLALLVYLACTTTSTWLKRIQETLLLELSPSPISWNMIRNTWTDQAQVGTTTNKGDSKPLLIIICLANPSLFHLLSWKTYMSCLANAGKVDCATVWSMNAGPMHIRTLRIPWNALTSSTCFVVNGPPYLCLPRSIFEGTRSIFTALRLKGTLC